MKYAYSRDEEEFYGDFDSREDAAAEGLAEADGGTVWTGRIKSGIEFLRAWHKSIGERTVEDIDASLYDYIKSDDAIIELAPEKYEELGKLIVDFLEKCGSFNRWGVVDIQAHSSEDYHE